MIITATSESADRMSIAIWTRKIAKATSHPDELDVDIMRFLQGTLLVLLIFICVKYLYDNVSQRTSPLSIFLAFNQNSRTLINLRRRKAGRTQQASW